MAETASRESTNGDVEPIQNLSEFQFQVPSKRIHDGPDVTFFLTSYAYRDIVTFILQLNHSMIPRNLKATGPTSTERWEIDSTSISSFSASVKALQTLIRKLQSFIEDAPPDTGPRRFGNVSFRKWYQIVESQLDDLLETTFGATILNLGSKESRTHDSEEGDDSANKESQPTAQDELKAYLLGSFGSPPRLDYGTGHELSFLAFIASLWKLGWFSRSEKGSEERGIVLGVFEPYLNLIRQLIKVYTLEPAGSHGVWGLDDNSFLPYVFGSAQLARAIDEDSPTPTEGSIVDAPAPSSVTKPAVVEQERKRNMYFSAIAFIYEVKKGPFWEHSPMLYDISGIKDGWGKINKGMLKMYNAEVLAKFPVVQHFPFGSLFRWEKDPNAVPPPMTTHSISQPLRNPVAPPQSSASQQSGQSTAAPWASAAAKPPVGMVDGVARAPWASKQPAIPPSGFHAATRAPFAKQQNGPGPSHGQLPTRAPWARKERDSTGTT
ncbi:MAG: hypothetical protein Q9160_008307 [Pyrenula sp. 1 TL-2023]